MREIQFLISSNTLPCARNFKPKFEFQTSLAQNSPVGTSELLPFGANLDLPWDWIFPKILLGDSSLICSVGVYYICFSFLGELYIYVNSCTSIFSKKYLSPTIPIISTYIGYVINYWLKEYQANSSRHKEGYQQEFKNHKGLLKQSTRHGARGEG